MRGRDFVLCWLQQALRAQSNPILEVATSLSVSSGMPLLVYHGLGCRYPHASWRLHQFILEASKSLEEDLATSGIALRRFVEKPQDARGLVHQLAERASVVVTDDQPVFVGRGQAEAVARRSRTAVWAVDAACAVPMNSFEDLIPTTKGFRAAHKALRPSHLDAVQSEPIEAAAMFEGELPFEHQSLERMGPKRLQTLVECCGVDMSVPPAPDFEGSREAADARLKWTLDEVLPNYNFRRNNASDPTAGSRLSPYLHFGVLGPREVAAAVAKADVHSAPRWKFLDELLTWREYFHHLARFEPRPDAYAVVPAFARKTLDEHRADEREALYSLDELVHGETADETWNAAQKQYLFEGYMHNNLRMYWGKRLIAWHKTPKEAWATACYLNDHFSLDGRDPATYGNLRWCFGSSKKAYSETQVYGWVPRKSDTAMRKRKGMPEWLAREAARNDYRVIVPEFATETTS